MKILLVNFADTGGGAALASLRLVESLNAHGVYARLGVPKKKSASPYVFELPKKRGFILVRLVRKALMLFDLNRAIFERFIPRPLKFCTTNGMRHTMNFWSETDIGWINSSDFDVVNLHWISGVISNRDIAKIKKPIVWTMHDSWPCCGAEHHPNIMEGDGRWKEGYFRKNKPASTTGIDLCRTVWRQKKKWLSSRRIDFIAPSTWQHDVLKSSALFGACKCTVVPNIIDRTVFYPKDKSVVRAMLGIPADKVVLGFGAAGDIDHPSSMKGSRLLLDALKSLENPDDYFLVVFGPASDAFTGRVSIPFFASGYVSNPQILSCLYCACDCFINPSRIENLPTMCLESVFCGVPVAAFDVGGTKDIVSHKENGYLARPYDAAELSRGVEWCVAHRQELSRACLEKARRDFDEDVILQKYLRACEATLS